MKSQHPEQRQRNLTIAKAKRQKRRQSSERTRLVAHILFFKRRNEDYRDYREVLAVATKQPSLLRQKSCNAHAFAWHSMLRTQRKMQSKGSYCKHKTECQTQGKLHCQSTPCTGHKQRKTRARLVFFHAYARAANGF